MIATRKPEEAAEMTVFITIWFGLWSLTEIYMIAPAFMNSEVIRIIRVPAKSILTSEAKNVLLQFSRYILKIKRIC